MKFIGLSYNLYDMSNMMKPKRFHSKEMNNITSILHCIWSILYRLYIIWSILYGRFRSTHGSHFGKFRILDFRSFALMLNYQ